MKSLKILVLALVLVLGYACKNDDDNGMSNDGPLFQCKVDGNNWSTDATLDLSQSDLEDFVIGAAAQFRVDTLVISGANVINGDSSAVELFLLGTPDLLGKYELVNLDFFNEPGTGEGYGFYFSSTFSDEQVIGLFFGAYNLDSTSHITITEVDEVERTVSGTFEFQYISPDPSSFPSIIVTEGVFRKIRLYD